MSIRELKALREYVETNSIPGVVINGDEKTGFICGYRAAQYDISKAHDLIDTLYNSTKEIKFFPGCFYNELELNFLKQRTLDKHFVHIKHTKRYRCIEPLTLKYIIVDNEE